MKRITATALIAGAIVLSAFLLGRAYIQRSHNAGQVHVTGLGKTDFTSDLTVWEASFSAERMDLQTAYAELERTKAIVREYLLGQGLREDEVVFNAVSTQNLTRRLYTADGDYRGEEFAGYRLGQSLEVKSNKVDLVERISREVTELLNQGVNLYSEAPRYYFTGLADLKVQMISKASEDARQRAEMIAQNAGGKLGDISSARMGVFQITGQHSNEDYSWGGTYNTSSREKTASITVKITFDVQD